MTCEEFSNEFDILYNNVMSNQAPGLDEYEKSVFLTRAQDDIVKRYFTPKGNKDFEGFDSSLKRNMDFSSLYRNYVINSEEAGIQQLDKDTVKSKYFDKVAAITLRVYSPKTVENNVEQGKSSYYIGNHMCYYALCDDDLKDISSDPNITIKNQSFAASFFGYDTSDGSTWSEICNVNTPKIDNNIEFLFGNHFIKFTVISVLRDVINISLLFSQENDSVFLPINDQLLVEDTVLKKDRLLQILPITSVEYIRLMSKPFKQPLKNQAWKLQEQSTDTSLSYKLFFGKNNNFKEYTLRYLTHPKPIILTNLGNEGLSINGYVGADENNQLVKEGAITGFTCQLNSELHYEILQRAVELAKAAYTGDLSSTIQIGNISSTNLGQGVDPQQTQRAR